MEIFLSCRILVRTTGGFNEARIEAAASSSGVRCKTTSLTQLLGIRMV